MGLRFGLRTLLTVVILLAVYIGSYRALLEPMISVEVGNLGMVIQGSRKPHYRSLNEICRVVFAPLERIDHMIRPKFWDEYSDFPDETPTSDK